MGTILRLTALGAASFALFVGVAPCEAAQHTAQEVYTGTIVWIGGTWTGQMRTATFTLTIDGYTSDKEYDALLSALKEGDQAGLLKAMSKNNEGNFAVTGYVGRVLGIVRVREEEGKRRLFIIFQRWLRMAEVRNGYRSENYPFGVIELVVNPDGKGEGTYIAAAQITWRTDKKTGHQHLNIEDFATYPARLMGVERRDQK
jgi:hypothetical protein